MCPKHSCSFGALRRSGCFEPLTDVALGYELAGCLSGSPISHWTAPPTLHPLKYASTLPSMNVLQMRPGGPQVPALVSSSSALNASPKSASDPCPSSAEAGCPRLAESVSRACSDDCLARPRKSVRLSELNCFGSAFVEALQHYSNRQFDRLTAYMSSDH